jgi:hypothetical protein
MHNYRISAWFFVPANDTDGLAPGFGNVREGKAPGETFAQVGFLVNGQAGQGAYTRQNVVEVDGENQPVRTPMGQWVQLVGEQFHMDSYINSVDFRFHVNDWQNYPDVWYITGIHVVGVPWTDDVNEFADYVPPAPTRELLWSMSTDSMVQGLTVGEELPKDGNNFEGTAFLSHSGGTGVFTVGSNFGFNHVINSERVQDWVGLQLNREPLNMDVEDMNASHEYRLYVFGRVVTEDDATVGGTGYAIVQAAQDPWTWLRNPDVEESNGYFTHAITLDFTNMSQLMGPQWATGWRVQHNAQPDIMHVYEIAMYRVSR